MTSAWVDVRIASTMDAGELLGILSDPAVQGAWQDEGAIHLYWPAAEWTPDHLVRLKWAARQLDGDRGARSEILVQSLENKDWNEQWARSVTPLHVGRRIVIRPSWTSVPLRADQIEIVLDPKQAFGTGHHGTTCMLLEWLEDVIRGGETVLDVGTGSGLLAMVALRLGAERAVGIDHDPVAIECAKEYAELNRFGKELTLSTDPLAGDQAYDLVLANLDRQTLLQLAEPLAACTGHRLLASGLLSDQRGEIIDAFAQVGLYPGLEREREGWLAIEFSHAQSCEGG